MKDNIVQQVIASPPNNYEAYIYRYTNLDNDKQYVGIHKGSVDDEYNHSSQSTEFAKVFADPKSKLMLEVIDFGSFLEMKTAEYSILSKNNANTNPLYYNGSVGSPAYVEPDLDKIKFLLNQIQDGIFPQSVEPISTHKDMEYLQTRFENNESIQKFVKERINDAKGVTTKCNPLIVLEGFADNGDDVRIDGSQTLFGASQAKHAIEVPVIRVPYDAHKDFTNAEAKRLGGLLNAIPDVVKGPMNHKDATKDILERHSEGVPYNATSNVDYLLTCGFTKAQINGSAGILLKSKQLIDEEEAQARYGKLFINYTAPSHSKTLQSTVEAYASQDGVCSTYMSSKKLSAERILEKLYANNTVDEKGKKVLDNSKIVVVIHHPTVMQSKKWKKTIQPLWINIFDKLLSDDYEVEFVELSMWMSDGSKKDTK